MLDLYIGIDPGEQNGVAVYDAREGLRLYSLSFWKVIEFIDNISTRQRTAMDIVPHFQIEDPGLNGFSYGRNVKGQDYVVALKIARNAGQNVGDARRIIERVAQKEMIHQAVRPLTQKWTNEFFQTLIRGRYEIKTTNQHQRDAAKLIAPYWAK